MTCQANFSDDDPAMLADEVRQILHEILSPSIEVTEGQEFEEHRDDFSVVDSSNYYYGSHDIQWPFVWVAEFGICKVAGGRFAVFCGNDNSLEWSTPWKVSKSFHSVAEATIHAVGCLIRDSIGY